MLKLIMIFNFSKKDYYKFQIIFSKNNKAVETKG